MTQFKVGDEVFVKGRVVGQNPIIGKPVVDIVGAYLSTALAFSEDQLHPLPSPPAAVEQPQEMSWTDVEYESTTENGVWIPASMCGWTAWSTNSSGVDHKLNFRHATTKDFIAYDHFLSLVNAAKAKAQPTAAQVNQATAVFAGMEREATEDAEDRRVWLEAYTAACKDGTPENAGRHADSCVGYFRNRFPRTTLATPADPQAAKEAP